MKKILIIGIIAFSAIAATAAGIIILNNNSDTGKEVIAIAEIAETGLYSLNNFYSEINTDQAVKKGWRYYYTTTNENGVPSETWECEPGSNTFMAYFSIRNTSEEPMRFLDEMRAEIIVNGEVEYGGRVFVENANQTDSMGEPVRSMLENDLMPGETAKYSTLIDIPNTLAESEEEMTLVITILGDKYEINLRENDNMILFKG